MTYQVSDFYTEFRGTEHVYAVAVDAQGNPYITFNYDENLFHPAKERTKLVGFHEASTLLKYQKELEKRYSPLLDKISGKGLASMVLLPAKADEASFPGCITDVLENYV